MKKKLFLVLLVLAAVVAWAGPDFSTFPEPIKPGDILVSAAGSGGISVFNFSGSQNSPSYSAPIAGGIGRLEYALPVPLIISIEGGYSIGRLEDLSFRVNSSIIPVMMGLSWHPNWGLKNFDTYTSIKTGFAHISFKDSAVDKNTNLLTSGNGKAENLNFVLASNLGGRYFFSPKFGVFGETELALFLGKMQKTRIMTVSPTFKTGVTFKF